MSRAVAALLVCVVAATSIMASADAAGIDNPPPTPTTTVVSDDEADVVGVGIGAPDGGSGGSGGGSGGGGGPVVTLPSDCDEGWLFLAGAVNTWMDPVSGNIMANWTVSCPGLFVLEPRVYRAPTVDDLIPGFYGQVLARIPVPGNAISPPAEAPINLGLWLAVDGATEVTRGGVVGPFVASVTARLVESSFEMGNGDVVSCAGAGVPIEDVDTVEQGPCGYTYRSDLAEGSEIVVTARWEIIYETSLGNGSLPDITTTASFPYDTYEIQTVGGPNDRERP